VTKACKGHPGAARALAENPDATRDIYADRCMCVVALEETGQDLARDWDHVDLPPIRPITTRINLFRATCPCCKARVTAQAPAAMPEGSPFGPGIKAAVAYLHGCRMVGFSHLRATIAVMARDELLVFLTRRDVEATNNESDGATALGDFPQSDE
jgi:hypothetical protein